jgi:hypothetical protein
MIAAAPAVAGATEIVDPGSGSLELCKTFAAAPAGQQAYQGTFTYTVSSGSGNNTKTVATKTINAVTGGPQVCTEPFAVPAGVTLQITEGTNSWSTVANVAQSPGSAGTFSWTSPSNSAYVTTVNSQGGSFVNTVEFTNDPVYGVVELCKKPAANSSALTGTYTFNLQSTTLKGGDPGIYTWDAKTGAYDLPWTTTASATISSAGLGCSGPTTVPAGGLQTVEPGTTYVTGISAAINDNSQGVLQWSNLNQGAAIVLVQAGNTTNQTIVTYTDAISTVKLCKQWYGRTPSPVASYSFTASSSGAAGPTAVASPVSLSPGNCQILGYVRAGTQVNITEGIVPGTKVGQIAVSPNLNTQGMSPIVPGSLSLPNRTVSVIAGAGETDITYVDVPADPGQLKICVTPTSGATNGTATFVVSGPLATTHSINVNVSATAEQCTLDPSAYAFDSAVTLSGSVPSPNAFTGTATALPANVEVVENGVLTPTNQPTLSAASASSATALISEATVTEVTFTIDPPAPATAPTQTATPTAAQVTANSVDLPSSGSGGSALSPAQVTAALRKQLGHVRAEIQSLEKKLSKKHLSKKARKADQKRLSALKKVESHVKKELK